jgi:hypothetical protein
MADIRPIVNIPHVATFTLRHPLAIALSYADITMMAKAWGSTLKNLDLNCILDIPERTSLGLSALIPIAQHCQHLEELRIYLDATLPMESLVDGAGLINPPKFSAQLRSIEFGSSPISDPSSAATFSSSILDATDHRVDVWGRGKWNAVRKYFESQCELSASNIAQ